MSFEVMNEERFSQLVNNFSDLKPLMVLGDVGIDKYTFGSVDRISPEAPVPVLNVKKEWLKLGMAANITHNLQTLNVPSTLFGVIGDDNHANVFEELLEEQGLKTWGLVRSEKRKTTFKERILTDTQQICRVDYESLGPLTNEQTEDLKKRLDDLSENHSAIIIEDYAKGTLSEDLCQFAIKLFRDKNILVAVDPGRDIPARFYRGANLLKPNLKEALLLTRSLGFNIKDPSEAAKVLAHELEIDYIVITLGGEGILLFERESKKETLIPTIPTEVYDVSGAGDTVISLLTSSLLSGATHEEACVIANCGAGVVVGKSGTATVDQAELKRFFQKYREFIVG
ncbi:MAG: bifunctional heptose 7-phosphate kinase/heptose 1-phosphate adenyltransferase [Bacteriovoracaceae bacterium]